MDKRGRTINPLGDAVLNLTSSFWISGGEELELFIFKTGGRR